VWNIPLTKELVGGASVWMIIGNMIMFRMVNFKI
jgi:Flp pilus assembly protein TadB